MLAGHNRLIHASGLNFADAGVGVPRVRMAAIQDYQRLRPRSQLKWNVPGCELPQPDGTYLKKDIPGPANFASWLTSWRVFRTACIMLDVVADFQV